MVPLMSDSKSLGMRMAKELAQVSGSHFGHLCLNTWVCVCAHAWI